MSFFVEDTGGSFEKCPPGLHLARCFRILDLGTQQTTFDGVSKLVHQIKVEWEIHGVTEEGEPLLMKDGRPFGVSKDYTFSWADQATLRKDLQAWRGKDFTPEEMRKFDLKNVLDAWCMVNCVEQMSAKGKPYIKVKSVSPVASIIKKQGYPAAVNKSLIFNLKDPDMVVFEGLPEFHKKKIALSPEWQKLQNKPVAKPVMETPSFDEDDDIPF
jgi:hypothetical protein